MKSEAKPYLSGPSAYHQLFLSTKSALSACWKQTFIDNENQFTFYGKCI